MPRLFTAIEIPSSVALQLSLLQNGLPGARWIDRENFHITLRFVGDVERPLACELAHELENVDVSPFQIQLADLGVFGRSKPHSLFAGVARNPALDEIRSQQDRICQRLGIAPDPRKFSPHVTIARIRGTKIPDIARYLSARGGFLSLPFEACRFVLLSSRDSTGGGPYVREKSYELVEEQIAAIA